MSLNPLSLRGMLASIAAAAVLMTAAAGHAQTGELFTGFQSNSKDPIEINAESLEVSEEGTQRVSVFSGNVVVRRGDTTLTASTIRVFSPLSGGDRPTGQGFNRIEASGNVKVASGLQTVTGKNVVVDMGKQTITMTGGVTMSQGPNVITGERLVVDLASGRARVEQAPGTPIRGVFTPN